MAQVVEAFRFLSARVETLEARLAAQTIRSTAPPGWSRRASSGAGSSRSPPTSWRARRRRGRARRLRRGRTGGCDRGRGTPVHGVEPRGAWPCTRSRADVGRDREMHEHLSTGPKGSLGGVVLSGVVDRLPVSSSSRCWPNAAGRSSSVRRSSSWPSPRRPTGLDAAGPELLDGRPLHVATWECCSSAPGSSRSRRAHRAGEDGGSPWPPSRPRERHSPLRPRPAPRRRGGPTHPPPPPGHAGPRVRSEIFVDAVDFDTEAETLPVRNYPGAAAG